MEKQIYSIPLLSADLIKQLDAQIPARCPEPEMPERQIWMYAGQRKLVESLLMRLNEQEERPN